MAKKRTVALVGNPNCGKTTVFNALTGSRQHVGNWPGKTVEKKEGNFDYMGYEIEVVDLPGTYSLTAYSLEELIARDYIVDEKPDIVVDIIDSTNLERNLYLATQLIELGTAVILAFNMTDLADKEGLRIDIKKISNFLKVPIIRITASKGIGLDKLKDAIVDTITNKNKISPKDKTPTINYGTEVEEHLNEFTEVIDKNITLPKKYNSRWIALKLLENDEEVISLIKTIKNSEIALSEAKKIRKHLKNIFGEDIETIIADARYGFIHGIVKEAVEKPIDRVSLSDQIDRVVTNRILGIPIFLGMMFLMFHMTFEVAAPLSDYVDGFIGFIGGQLVGLLESGNAPEWLISLIVDGVIAGVGSVLVFVPFIFMLFFIIAILEDSGYMARAAFVMDRVMHKIGLHGKSFIPMIIGFGCNVPAIMATRVLESKKDRILTILINPFMSCGARLPVYILFVAAFFPERGSMIVYSLYILGIIVAIIMGFILKKIFFKGLSSPFVMELPPYRLPTLRGTITHVWERGWLFIKKAGTVIFTTMIIIWLLAALPPGVEYGSEKSGVGMIGKAIAPVFSPLGFGDWKSSVSLFFGFVAKEVVVGSFGVLYAIEDVESPVGEETLIGELQNTFTPLSAYAFLVFVLLYAPCMVAIAVIKREIGWKWAAFTAIYTTAVAWVAAFIVYQGGMLLGFG